MPPQLIAPPSVPPQFKDPPSVPPQLIDVAVVTGAEKALSRSARAAYRSPPKAGPCFGAVVFADAAVGWTAA